jgi:hypothetical protein
MGERQVNDHIEWTEQPIGGLVGASSLQPNLSAFV